MGGRGGGSHEEGGRVTVEMKEKGERGRDGRERKRERERERVGGRQY